MRCATPLSFGPGQGLEGATCMGGQRVEITKGMVEVQGAGGKLPAYVARPSSGGPHPGVVVVMEAFGLNGHMKKVAERIAGEGYAAIAPNLYHRAQGKQVVGYDELPAAIGLMTGLSDAQILED